MPGGAIAWWIDERTNGALLVLYFFIFFSFFRNPILISGRKHFGAPEGHLQTTPATHCLQSKEEERG